MMDRTMSLNRVVTLAIVLALVGCGSDDAPTTAVDAASGDASSETPAVGGCATTATSEACVSCCRQPDAPNYGGFELYAYAVCQACPDCKDKSPCGTNVTPPAGKACVECLQKAIAMNGVPADCTTNAKCQSFANCLTSCPVR
jgi:hypothetical protein